MGWSIKRHIQPLRRFNQPPVAAPKLRARVQMYRGQQVVVHVTDAATKELPCFNEFQHFRLYSRINVGQISQNSHCVARRELGRN